MWPLDPPSVSADDSYRACTESIRDRAAKPGSEGKPGKPARAYRSLLAAAAPDVGAASRRFEIAALGSTLHDLKAADCKVPGFEDDEAHQVIYGRGMVGNTAGRVIYDALMAAPAHERCPFCGHGMVRELDHHLPKTSHPALCVTPLNLVPACRDCNKIKGTFTPRTADTVLIHPYFDRIDNEPWLNASVVHTPDPTLDFVIDPPDSWDQVITNRVEHHFELFGLKRVFGTQANRLVSNIRHGVERLVRTAGAEAVRAYLREEAETRFESRLNGWEGVTFHALAEDDWFCQGRFMDEADSAD